MQDKILRKMFLGFIHIHILHHAKKPFYGTWMIEELKEHGYDMSPGTLYPILHDLEEKGILTKSDVLVEGKIRKYYGITPVGETVLDEARKRHMNCLRRLNNKVISG